MSEHSGYEPDGTEHPIAVVRSAPVRLRFETRTHPDAKATIGLATYYGDRRIAMAAVPPSWLQEIGSAPGWKERVHLVALGSVDPETGVLHLSVFAEVPERVGWTESEVREVYLGSRFRGSSRRRFPNSLERETRDFFLSLLQGPPRAAIEALCEAATRESIAMHPIWERCRQAAIEDGLPPTAYKPGRDIYDGLSTRRWKKADLDGEAR